MNKSYFWPFSALWSCVSRRSDGSLQTGNAMFKKKKNGCHASTGSNFFCVLMFGVNHNVFSKFFFTCVLQIKVKNTNLKNGENLSYRNLNIILSYRCFCGHSHSCKHLKCLGNNSTPNWRNPPHSHSFSRSAACDNFIIITAIFCRLQQKPACRGTFHRQPDSLMVCRHWSVFHLTDGETGHACCAKSS